MKCEMIGKAGRLVVRFADVPARLKRGYGFATKKDEADYKASLEPRAESPATAPEGVENEFVDVESDTESPTDADEDSEL